MSASELVTATADGGPIVIEVKVLEPSLFMAFDPPSAERFAEATVRRLR